MKLKRGIVLLVGIIMMLDSTNVVFAKNIGKSQAYKEETLRTDGLIDEKNQARIDQLYEKRLRLCTDYDKNRKEINLIDKKIEKLGAVELDSAEVVEKVTASAKGENVILGRETINVKVPREAYIRWTSTRRKMTYNGIVYEVQELHAVPTSSRSSLYLFGAKYKFGARASKIRANNVLLKSVIPSVLGCTPTGVGELASAISIFQSCREFCDNLKGTSTVENIETSYENLGVTEYILDYVKISGYADEGHQVLCYVGNRSGITVATNIPVFEYRVKNNIAKGDIQQSKYNLTVTSPKYNNRNNTACKNYYDYSRKKSIKIYYNVQKIDVVGLKSKKITLRIPRPNYGF